MFAAGGQLEIAVVGFGLFVVLMVLLRLSRGARGSARDRVVVLTGAHRLHVVEIDGRRLLVGTGPSGPPQLLTELGDSPPWVQGAASGGWNGDGH